MAVIKPKKTTVIQPGISFSYNPQTFLKEHKVPFFYEAKNAQEILDNIKPFEFRGMKIVTFDTETYATAMKDHEMPTDVVRRWVKDASKKEIPQDYPFCISVCDGVRAYTLYDSVENNFAEIKKLKPLLEDCTIDKVAHNAKFDMHSCANAKVKLKGKMHDTVVIAKLANENRDSFRLMDLAAALPQGITKFEYMVDGYKKQYKIASYRAIPRELLTEYANADVWNCFWEFVTEYPILERDELIPLYHNEMELMMCYWAMERYGMKADAPYEEPLKNELQTITDAAEKAIYEEAGGFFNINSGKQLYTIFMKLGVNKDWIKFTDKGNPTLDKKALEVLGEVHEVSIVKRILEFRKYEKLLGTYAVGIYQQMDAACRVHGSINQTEATTGRSSITKPALQTLPKKDKRIRRIFIPADGFELWFLDLDQVEYRGFAHYAIAKGLIQAIKEGKDVHQATAAIIYNVPYEEVTEEQRTRAKTVNFSLIYGQGDEASANSLKMTIQMARRFKDGYFAQIPEAKPFIDTVQRVTKTRGYIKNSYGRRRRLKYDEAYKAPNALIQGWAADYIKHKIVRIFKFLLVHGYKTRLINVVHDELIPEVFKAETFLVPKLRWLLSDFDTFRVPITAGCEKGDPSWGQKVEPEDVGFEATTEEEELAIKNCDVFDGSVFDLFLLK